MCQKNGFLVRSSGPFLECGLDGLHFVQVEIIQLRSLVLVIFLLILQILLNKTDLVDAAEKSEVVARIKVR